MFSWLRKNFTFKRKKYDSRINRHHKPIIINPVYDEDDEIIAEEYKTRKQEKMKKKEIKQRRQLYENKITHNILKLDIFPDINNNEITQSRYYKLINEDFEACYNYDNKTYPDQVHLYTDTHLQVIVKCMLLITKLIGDLKPEYDEYDEYDGYAEFENYINYHENDLILIENTILLLQKVLSLIYSIISDMQNKKKQTINNGINTTYFEQYIQLFKKYIPFIEKYIKLYEKYIKNDNGHEQYYTNTIGLLGRPRSGGKTKKCKTRKYKRKKI